MEYWWNDTDREKYKHAGGKPVPMTLYFPQISYALRQGLNLGLRDKTRRGQYAAACGES
jgi:hypothetical protein